jgi:hypothetical protein
VSDNDDSPSPSPSGAAAGSSTGSSAGSPFIAEPGGFDPDAAAAEPPPAAGANVYALPEPPPEWEREQVEAILTAKGAVLHTVLAVDKSSDEWRYTDTDLRAIAPPLTRILNRYDATRAAAGTGDEIAVMIGLTGYVGRSWRERREALADLAERPPEPVSGRAAEAPVFTAEPAGGGPAAETVPASPVGSWEPPTAPGGPS